MPRPIHFEVHAEQPERALKFYAGLFGWQANKWEGPVEYWLLKTGEPGTMGIDGGLFKRLGAAPADKQAVNAYVCTVDVPNVDAALKHGVELGGVVADPKRAIPGVGWLAYLKDTEGNIFGMMTMDPNAR